MFRGGVRKEATTHIFFHEALRELYAEYRAGLEAVRMPYEFVFVMDGPHRDAMAEVGALIDEGRSMVHD